VEIFIFAVACLTAVFCLVAINEISKELRGIRSVLETHTNLEPVKVRTYERRDDGGAQL
jgi:hypothetical protein